MKVRYWVNLFFLIAIVIREVLLNTKRGNAKFDKAYRDCSGSQSECGKFNENENCVYKCMSLDCYNQVYGDYILEMGEMHFDLKKKFEKCYINFTFT